MADFLRDVERDARLKRMSAMLPPGEITLRNALALIDDIKGYCELHSIPQSRLADSIGTTASYVSTVFTKSEQLFQSNPPLNCKTRDKLLRAMASFMEEHARQARPATGKVIATGVFELILGGARTIKAEGMIGLVTAPAGMGKTACCEFIAGDTELPGTMLVRVDYGSQYATGFMRAVFNAARVHGRTRAVVRFDHVVDRLKGSGRLLIVDQAHNLHNGALRVIQDLHDAVELPILLVGTIDIRNRLSDARDPLFTQLSSRVGLRIDIPTELLMPGRSGRVKQWVTTKQLREIIAGGKLRFHPETLAQLVRIANTEPGYLRRAKYLARLAERYARFAERKGANDSGEIAPAHLEEAIRLVEGESRVLPRVEAEELVEAAG